MVHPVHQVFEKSSNDSTEKWFEFLDGFNSQAKKSPVSGVSPTRATERQAVKEEMPVVSRGIANPMSNDKQGMDDIKIPTFLTNKKQED
ncbi:MAG: hypothetical protein ACLSD6_03285 [Clostridium sp.]